MAARSRRLCWAQRCAPIHWVSPKTTRPISSRSASFESFPTMLVGGFKPSERYWSLLYSQLGYPIYYGKLKFMFPTTNQNIICRRMPMAIEKLPICLNRQKIVQFIVPYTSLDYQTWLLLLKHRGPRTPLIIFFPSIEITTLRYISIQILTYYWLNRINTSKFLISPTQPGYLHIISKHPELVGGIPTPLNIWKSVWMMKFPIYGKS